VSVGNAACLFCFYIYGATNMVNRLFLKINFLAYHSFNFNLNIVNFNISMYAKFFDFISIINLNIYLVCMLFFFFMLKAELLNLNFLAYPLIV
jgi:hypothetical protein